MKSLPFSIADFNDYTEPDKYLSYDYNKIIELDNCKIMKIEEDPSSFHSITEESVAGTIIQLLKKLSNNKYIICSINITINGTTIYISLNYGFNEEETTLATTDGGEMTAVEEEPQIAIKKETNDGDIILYLEAGRLVTKQLEGFETDGNIKLLVKDGQIVHNSID